MCLLTQKLQEFLANDRSEKVNQGSAYKWKPVKITKCQEKGCNFKKNLRSTLVDFIEDHLKATINPDTMKPFEESKFQQEALEFSELDRVVESTELSRKEMRVLIQVPSRELIDQFIKAFLKVSEATCELLIFGMILLERLLKVTGWPLRPTNWRILWMLSIKLAQKIEGRLPVSNHTLNYLYPLFEANEFADLERVYLQVIDYNCYISYEEYARFLHHILPSTDANQDNRA